MARQASGREFLTKAKNMLAKAKTVDELRQAQALILPLEYGFSMEQAAAVRANLCVALQLDTKETTKKILVCLWVCERMRECCCL